MRASSLLVCLLLAGCHDSVTAAPTQVSSVAGVPAATTCAPFDVKWLIDIDASGPIVTLAPVQLNATDYQVEELSGNPWQFFASGGWNVPPFPFSLPVHFDMRYRIAARVNGCWSTWHEFTTGPVNPNASGDDNLTPVGTVDRHYSQTRCVQAKDMVAGISEVLTFNAPMGSYRVTATTWDKFHKAGYQVGQLETAIIAGFGVTEDIGDLETSHSTSWTTRLPISEIRVTGNAGSLHGDGGAVCVTVEEL